MSETQTHTPDSIQDSMQDILGISARPWYRRPSALLAGSGVLILVIVGSLFLFSGGETSAVRYKSAPVQRGDLQVTVTATGVLQPVNQVDIGTEISGTVKSVFVDFNDRVRKGQLLARLNTDQLEAKARQSEAALQLAKASVSEAEATVKETGNKLTRSLELKKTGMCTADECDAAQAAYDRAAATLVRARAQVTQAQAQLDADRSALKKAAIVSPINGIVLKRQVEPGQTVAASFQTPVLFTLAENLAQMELKVAVDEADIGQVKEGQQATFTVDAYQDDKFHATISQVRYAPQTVEGVVTYETVLTVDNSNLKLRPGMTATAEIVVARLHDVTLIPNAALRFTPPVTPGESARSGSLLSRLMPRHRPRGPKEAKVTGSNEQRIWLLQNDQAVAASIRVGATDGVMSEVRSDNLEPGAIVIVDTLQQKKP